MSDNSDKTVRISEIAYNLLDGIKKDSDSKGKSGSLTDYANNAIVEFYGEKEEKDDWKEKELIKSLNCTISSLEKHIQTLKEDLELERQLNLNSKTEKKHKIKK
jgi:hypothetical protein